MIIWSSALTPNVPTGGLVTNRGLAMMEAVKAGVSILSMAKANIKTSLRIS